MPPQSSVPLSYSGLKAKQRRQREAWELPVVLRVHRALSWYGRAEQSHDDPDVRFVLQWIAFNAAYASDLERAIGDRHTINAFFATLVGLDRDGRIYNAVWDRFSQEIRVLLDNRYIFAPFWRHQNGEPGFDDWEQQLSASRRAATRALARRDTPRILTKLFDRLYVLRNQLVHGGATWNGRTNREQLRDANALLGWLLPLFIDIMMDNPRHLWGMPHYPALEPAATTPGGARTIARPSR